MDSSVLNLISDTVTKPSKEMLQYMMEVEVGDDVFGQDPTVNRLQQKVAAIFGKERALFCPSGTMTNQIAIKINTNPLDEMICDITSHVYQYETGGYGYNSRIGVKLIHGQHGKINEDQLREAINPEADWLTKSQLVVIENSCNKGGGSYYTLAEMARLHHVCRNHNLRFHLDGARIFNVLVETEDQAAEIGKLFDTISICLSKGLGAPVGSLLIGSEVDIKRARRYRKVMGGGMRQAGILAGAGIYALENNLPLLKIDNDRAKQIGAVLQNSNFVNQVYPVKTNIVIFEVRPDFRVESILEVWKSYGLLASKFSKNTIRLVTHQDITDSMFQKCVDIISKPISTNT